MPANSVHDAALDALRRYILANRLSPGDPLPPLADLAEEFGASVSSVREAVRSLEASGVVQIRHGVGLFLKAYDYAPILRNLTFSALFEPEMQGHLLQVRRAIEIGAVAPALDTLTVADLDELAVLVSAMGREGEARAAEHRFHMVLFQRLGNPLLMGILRLCSLGLGVLSDGATVPARPHYALHLTLLTALNARDSQAAQSALDGYFALLEAEMPNPI